jgi:hypothetical protein
MDTHASCLDDGVDEVVVVCVGRAGDDLARQHQAARLAHGEAAHEGAGWLPCQGMEGSVDHSIQSVSSSSPD